MKNLNPVVRIILIAILVLVLSFFAGMLIARIVFGGPSGNNTVTDNTTDIGNNTVTDNTTKTWLEDLPEYKPGSNYLDLTDNYYRYSYYYSTKATHSATIDWTVATEDRINIEALVKQGYTYLFIKDNNSQKEIVIQIANAAPNFRIDYTNMLVRLDEVDAYEYKFVQNGKDLQGYIEASNDISLQGVYEKYDFSKGTVTLVIRQIPTLEVPRSIEQELKINEKEKEAAFKVEGDYLDLTEEYNHYQYAYAESVDGFKEEKWYKPTGRKLDISNLSKIYPYVAIKENGKTEFVTIQISNTKPNFKLDYNTLTVTGDTKNQYQYKFISTNSTITPSSFTDLNGTTISIEKAYDVVDSEKYIVIRIKPTDKIPKSVEQTIKISVNLPIFSAFDSIVDLGSNYEKFNMAYRDSDNKLVNQVITRNVNLDEIYKKGYVGVWLQNKETNQQIETQIAYAKPTIEIDYEAQKILITKKENSCEYAVGGTIEPSNYTTINGDEIAIDSVIEEVLRTKSDINIYVKQRASSKARGSLTTMVTVEYSKVKSSDLPTFDMETNRLDLTDNFLKYLYTQVQNPVTSDWYKPTSRYVVIGKGTDTLKVKDTQTGEITTIPLK